MYIVIAGGGSMGGTLARRLQEGRHDVVVIEQDKSVCEQIAARTGVVALHGTATDIQTLEDAGIRKADVAVGTLPMDAGNLAFALLAREFEVPRIIARMRSPRYETAYRLAGVHRTVAIGELFVRDLLLEIEQPALRQLATFGGGRGCVAVAVVPERSLVHGKMVQEIVQDKRFPSACLIAGIFRQESDEFIIPRGSVEVRSGDKVFLAASAEDITKAAAVLQKTR